MGKMSENKFNLVTEPWIKVVDTEGQEQTVSLEKLFQNTASYQQLAGEMRSQDLAILRFLLSILTTVYSRYDDQNKPYDWIEIDKQTMQPVSINDEEYDSEDIEDDLQITWRNLYQSGTFSQIVTDYLKNNQDNFDLLNKEKPFYQVTREQYDNLVPKDKSVSTGKGTVSVKQINRTISESNNKPDIFSPSSSQHKNDVSLDSLARWLITYQNFTAVTDKTKVESEEKFSVSRGWLYGLNPVFAEGNNLFETLLLNLVLIPQPRSITKDKVNQKPVWEFSREDYIQLRIIEKFPYNIAQLYTTWSRVIHIEWEDDRPLIFSAGLPKLDNEDAFLEQMTTWKPGKKGEGAKPNLRWLNSLGRAMWRNFGQYISINHQGGDLEPGIVEWLHLLKKRKYISQDSTIHLVTIGLINDGNATSQSPAAEFVDDMRINAAVLFDSNESKQRYWPSRIEDTVLLTDKIGSYVWRFGKNIANLRGLNDPGAYANKVSAVFFARLNQPFNEWLASLTNNDERDAKVNEWKQTLRKITLTTASDLLSNATPQEIRGKDDDGDIKNIFIYYQILTRSVAKSLGTQKGEKNDSTN